MSPRAVLYAAALAAALQGSAAAQVIFGAEAGPDSFIRNEEARIERSSLEPFAQGVAAVISSAALYAVFGSTSPEKEMTGYLRSGFYRQELLVLIRMSELSGEPFKTLAKEISKGGSLREAGRKRGIDVMRLMRETRPLKEKAEALMPEPPPVSTSTVKGADPAGPAGEDP